jgi:hypothetical protein
MTDSALGKNSNCLAVPGKDPSSIFSSFNFGTLEECLVVGFLGGIFYYREKNLRNHVSNRMLIHKNETAEMIKLTHTSSSH